MKFVIKNGNEEIRKSRQKKIAQVCQTKNSGRNQQMCEQCVFKKMI